MDIYIQDTVFIAYNYAHGTHYMLITLVFYAHTQLTATTLQFREIYKHTSYDFMHPVQRIRYMHLQNSYGILNSINILRYSSTWHLSRPHMASYKTNTYEFTRQCLHTTFNCINLQFRTITFVIPTTLNCGGVS